MMLPVGMFLVYCMILILRGFFTPNTKMLELMDEDAQLKKAPFLFSLLICIYDALNSIGYNGLLHLFL